jgi:hypothetical protein
VDELVVEEAGAGLEAVVLGVELVPLAAGVVLVESLAGLVESLDGFLWSVGRSGSLGWDGALSLPELPPPEPEAGFSPA